MKTIEDINFKDKRALIRVDFNVPLTDDFKVADDTRIRAALPTILTVLERGGSVVLMSHLGRPKGERQEAYSLLPVVNHLSQIIDNEVLFAQDCIGEPNFKLSKNLVPGQILVLENLRFHKEETEGNREFAKELSRHGEVYINDAFGTAHRAHASTAIIAEFFNEGSKCFGKLMTAEVNSLTKALSEGSSPVTAVIGGAKVSSKIDVLQTLLDKVDNVIIGGGMAYTFARAKGGQVGSSLVEEDKLDVARELLIRAEAKKVGVFLPVDSVNCIEFGDIAPASTTSIMSIPEGEMGLDIGPESIDLFSKVLVDSKTIIWNGPMGVFEFSNYENGTKATGKAIVESTKNGAFSLVGGGDSVAAAKKYSLDNGLSYVSTGGGAMLEYMEGKELPGIKAIIG